MKILAAHDGLGCGYIRIVQPLRELAKHGHEVTLTETMDPETIRLLGRGAEFDVIVGQRFAGYNGMGSFRRARTPKNRLVYEVDDDLFNLDKANWAAFQQFTAPDVQEAIHGYTLYADLMTVTTEALAQLQRDHLGVSNVAVLPNCIPEYLLETSPTTNRKLRIGYAGGASHGADMLEMVSDLRRFLARNQDWDLMVVGTDYRPTINAKNWDQMHFADWKQINKDERAYYDMLDFDIGLVPVRDTAFGRSKSPLKCLEYNARGIPAIASNVRPYQEYIVHGENGFLVKQKHEWGKYIHLLASNPDLRMEMSEKARVHASAWTHEANWKRWESAYEGLF